MHTKSVAVLENRSRRVQIGRAARALVVASAIGASWTPAARAQSTATTPVSQPLAVVGVASANLRARPSLEGAVVGRLARGDTVRIVLQRPDGWSRVQARRQDAWVRTNLLSRMPSTVQSSPIAENPATERQRPSPEMTTQVAGDSTSASPTPTATVVAGDAEDPRLAGRKRRSSGASSTIPPSRDRSRIGVMAGVASGAWLAKDFTGPALRAYSRIPLTQSPFAMRADVEVSRVSAGGLPKDWHWRLGDARALVGAEFGVPVLDLLEVSVVGSLGVARQTFSVRANGVASDAPAQWRVAHDVGLGAKVSRMLIVELHFFSSDGAPVRLLAGVRL